MKSVTFAVALTAILSSVSYGAQKSIRFVALDKSGSMSTAEDGGAPRINVAKEEIRQMANVMPASVDHPLVIVPFEASSKPPEVYVSNAELLRRLSELQAGGGTSIADGLTSVSTLLSRPEYRDAERAIVMIITDGEDNNTEGILQAEQRLNQLFENRNSKNLQNSVYVKSWGQAGQEMVDRWTARGSADVTAVGDAQLQQVVIVPSFRVISSTRKSRDQIDVVVGVTMSSRSQIGITPKPVAVTCTSTYATGDIMSSVPVTSDEKQLELKVNIPAGQRKSVPLEFTLKAESSINHGNVLCIVTLSAEKIVLDATIPIRLTKLELVKVEIVDNRWVRIQNDRARITANVVIKCDGVEEPFDLSFEPDSQVTLHSQPRPVRGDGEIVLPVQIEADHISSDVINRFELNLATPTNDSEHRYDTDPIVCEFKGPEALALTLQPIHPREFRFRVPFFSRECNCRIRLAMEGGAMLGEGLTEGFLVEVAIGENPPQSVRLGDEIAFDYQLPSPQMFDCRYADVSVFARPDCMSVQGIQQDIVVEHEGFFPYLIAATLTVLAAIVPVYFVCALLRRRAVADVASHDPFNGFEVGEEFTGSVKETLVDREELLLPEFDLRGP